MAEKPQRARWRKIWIDVLSSPSLLAASHTDLWVFVTLLLHAWWARGEDEGYVWVEHDEPMPRALLARQARVATRQLAKSITVLAKAKVIELRGEVIVIPKFGRWQESADASRKRRVRAMSGGHGPDSPPDKTEPKEKGREKGKVIPQPPGGATAGATDAEPPRGPDPPPRDRNPDVNEREVRAQGIVLRDAAPVGAALASSGDLHELDIYRRELAAELQVELPRWGGQGGQVLDGIGRALDELGGDRAALRAVIRHAAEGVREGAVKPVFFRRMFVGDGFGARLDAWREAQAPRLYDIDPGEVSADEIRRTLGRAP